MNVTGEVVRVDLDSLGTREGGLDAGMGPLVALGITTRGLIFQRESLKT